MTSTDTTIIAVLNDLIAVQNDRVQGYEAASHETDDAELKSLFSEMANRSHRFKQELSSEVLHMDEEPTEFPTTSGRALRTRMDLKAALTEKNRRAILSSCATGEFAALRTYKEALESEAQLPVREMIEKQFIMLRHDHDRIRGLRDSTTK